MRLLLRTLVLMTAALTLTLASCDGNRGNEGEVNPRPEAAATPGSGNPKADETAIPTPGSDKPTVAENGTPTRSSVRAAATENATPTALGTPVRSDDPATVQSDATPEADTTTTRVGQAQTGSEGQAEPSPSAVVPLKGDAFVSVSAGEWHTCAVRVDGTVACWGGGYNDYGQATPPEGKFASVSSGVYHTCGVRADGSADCWGSGGGRTRLGEGEFVSLSAGLTHTCGVKTDGSMVCRSDDTDGEVAPPPEGDFVSVSAGRGNSGNPEPGHTCGVTADGSVVCWGDNWDGQADAPDGEFVSVSAGDTHTCGIRPDGAISCWGEDYDGRASPPEGEFASVSAGGTPYLRPEGRWIYSLLGQQPFWPNRAPGGRVRRRQLRDISHLRCKNRRLSRMLGQ